MDGIPVATRGTLPFPELASWSIDYQSIVISITPSGPNWMQVFEDRLTSLWREIYSHHHPAATELHLVHDDGGKYVYDSTWSATGNGSTQFESIPDDRVVAAIGISRAEARARPATRIRGFPRGGLGILFPELAQDFDRGHHLAHAAGGGVDINLYPQLATVNRGQEEDGRLFRAMERYAARHDGTLVFSRPLYFGISDHPAAIEYGVLRADGALWHEVFPNVRTLQHLIALDKALRLMRTHGWSRWPENGASLLRTETP